MNAETALRITTIIDRETGSVLSEKVSPVKPVNDTAFVKMMAEKFIKEMGEIDG